MMKKLLLLLLIAPVFGFGQDYKTYDFETLLLCTDLQTYSFSDNSEASKLVNTILGVVGIQNNFIVKQCPGSKGVYAAEINNLRFILFDDEYVESLTNNDKWTSILILAHEVGHHVNGHPLDYFLQSVTDISEWTLMKKRKKELEADEFAGFVLAKLGGPIEVGVNLFNKIASDDDDTYKTHPKSHKRIKAFEKGYNKANSINFNEDNIKTAEEYFYDGLVHFLLDEFDLAIDDFTTSIIKDRKFYPSLFYRAMSFQKLNDLNSSNFDFLLYLKKNKKDPEVLFQLGVNYYNMSEFKKSINYLDLSISIDSTQRDAYLYRGLSNLELKNLNIGCEDFEVYVTNGGELPDLIKNICDFE